MSGELIFNLWAIYDATSGFVYGLAGKAYCASGGDSDKLSVLKYLSATDYVTAKRYKLPSRFRVSYTGGTFKTGVTFLNAVNDPNAQLFEEIFKNLETELPPLHDFSEAEYKGVKQKVPDDPLCVVTILYEDERGIIRPIITEEDKQWVAHQEQLRGRKRWV